MAQPPALLRDSAGAVLLALLCLVPGLADKGLVLGELSPQRPADALAVVLILAQCLPLAVRGKWSGLAFAMIGVAFAAHQLLGYAPTVASLGLLVALYSVGGQRVAPAVGGAGYVLLAIGLHERGSPEAWFDFATFAIVLAAAWGLGAWVRGRREREAERRRAAAAAAVAGERARIARELHDVVTHHVTAMVVQADAAQFQTDPVPALENVSETGRQALGELRHLLGVLNAPPEMRPVTELVARIRDAGQPVEFTEQGSPALLAAGAELAAYRVVQEGLTNALKHAAGRRTVVTIAYGAEATEISVRTDGPVVEQSGGHGLTGLQDRVGVFGGELTAGPRAEGGFLLAATIPAGGPS